MTPVISSPPRETVRAADAEAAARDRARRFERLSAGQQRVWELERLSAANDYYERIPLRLRGPLDPRALDLALRTVVQRHEVLRTVFPVVQGRPLQRVLHDAPHALSIVDLRDLAASRREPAAMRLLARGRQPRFDTVRGPLLRVWLIRLDEREAMLAIAVHHLIFDGWSTGILLRELAESYAACVAGGRALPSPAPRPFKNIARDEARFLASVEGTRQIADWCRTWTEQWEDLRLPLDHPRPTHRTGRAGVETIAVSAETLRSLRETASREGATLFMTMLAAIAVTLHRATRQTSIAMGVAVTNRAPDAEAVIGPCVNLLILCVRVDPRGSLRDALEAARDMTTRAYAAQGVPFLSILRALRPDAVLAPYGVQDEPPRFRVAFDYHIVRDTPSPAIGDLRVEPVTLGEPRVGCDLALTAIEREGSLDVSLLYSLDILTPASGARLAHELASVLNDLARAPGLVHAGAHSA